MPDNHDSQNYDLDAKFLVQMKTDFLEEAKEYLDQLNLNLTRLEEMPQDEELINEIFRAAHTLKGSASFVGLDTIREVAHRMEDVFGAIRKKTLKVTASIIDDMFEGLEVLTLIRDKAVANDPVKVPIDIIVTKLAAIMEQILPKIEEIPGQVKTRSFSSMAEPEPAALISEKTFVSPKTIAGSETIRVPIKKLDSLVNLAGELITSRNNLNEFAVQLKNDELNSIASTINNLTSQLHTNALAMRMVPIETLFIKFPGVVRNLARERGKEVDFVIKGKETELDKNVIEQMYDPLVHLLRNAIDHGIETRETRQDKGKPRAGKITLSSWHHNNNVVIEISDDGKGIDPDRMRKAAVQKGIITQEEALAMTDDQAIKLIFAPGFSTAEKVTNISGRGVGMDVVKENVQKLRGIVDVITHIDKGTAFKIQMPLTLAILEVLLVRVSGLTYSLPIHAVNETLLIKASKIQTIEKREVIFIRDIAYPFKRLSTLLNLNFQRKATEKQNQYLSIVVVGLAEKRMALCVDELLGKQDVVMKPLGDYLGKAKGIEGAFILADGNVTLIIDVEAVL